MTSIKILCGLVFLISSAITSQATAATPDIQTGNSSAARVALDPQGYVWQWNYRTPWNTNAPIQKYPHKVPAGPFSQIAVGADFVIALGVDGTVISWETNETSDGQLGRQKITGGNVLGYNAFGAVANVPKGVAVAARGSVAGMIGVDGSVWMWGSNYSAQLGNGTSGSIVSNTESIGPVKVRGLTNIIKLSIGDSHVLALDSAGSVWAWGNNESGQIGDTTTIERPSPVKIIAQAGITNIIVGPYYNMAIAADGKTYAWGQTVLNISYSEYNQIFLKNFPEIIDELYGKLSGFKNVYASTYAIQALTNDGRLVQILPNDGQNFCRGATEAHIGSDGLLTIFSNVKAATLSSSINNKNIYALKNDGSIIFCQGHQDTLFSEGFPYENSDGISGLGTGFPTMVNPINEVPVLTSDRKTPFNLFTGTGNSAQASSIMAFATTTDTYRWSWQQASINVEIIPEIADISTVGKVFIAAYAGGQWLFAKRNEWVPIAVGQPHYYEGILQPNLFFYDLLHNIDLTLLPGLQIYAGYGDDVTEMVSAGRFKLLFTVPHHVALECISCN